MIILNCLCLQVFICLACPQCATSQPWWGKALPPANARLRALFPQISFFSILFFVFLIFPSFPPFRNIRAASAWCWFVHHCSPPARSFGYAFCAFQHASATANTRSSCVPSSHAAHRSEEHTSELQSLR